jgi:hypothetical protein
VASSDPRARFIVKRPGFLPRIEESIAGQEAFEAIAMLVAHPVEFNALAEATQFNPRIAMYSNAKARSFKMETNFIFEEKVLRGTVVFARLQEERKSITDMRDTDIADVITFFSDFEGLSKVDDSNLRCFFCHSLLDGTPHDCPVSP